MNQSIQQLDYRLLIENDREILRYASAAADSFSVITELMKPYSADPPRCKHEEFLLAIRGSLIRQTPDVKSWPGTKTSAKHKVLMHYQITKAAKKWLSESPNLFLLCDELPQDICFYRSNQVWLYTVTHEKEAVLLAPTEADMAFFRNLALGQRDV